MSGYDDILLAKLQVLLGERGTPSAKRAVRDEEISGDNVAFVTKPGGGIASLANGSLADLAVGFKTRPNTGIYLDINDLIFVEDGVEIARLTVAGLEITGFITGTAVTQSNVDSTIGRLLKVGDFGIGHNGAAPALCADIDSLTIATGIYATDDTVVLGTFPAGEVSKYGTLVHRRYNANLSHQIWSSILTDVTWTRRYYPAAGGWQPWAKVYSSLSPVPNVTAVAAGLAPASGGGTTNFLRADGTWAAPSGGGGGGGGSPISGWLA